MDQVQSRAGEVLATAGIEGRIAPGNSAAGAGSAPAGGIPTALVVVDRPGAEAMWPRLLSAEPRPVVARRDAGSTLIDLRTVEPDDDPEVAEALGAACRS
jgi:hypothetical protein